MGPKQAQAHVPFAQVIHTVWEGMIIRFQRVLQISYHPQALHLLLRVIVSQDTSKQTPRIV